jgi:diaminohydroxyphosphoribosylaminopyrimidine deaminase/5-amino-6-(5-phosphoribosylamino)uracil reductase
MGDKTSGAAKGDGIYLSRALELAMRGLGHTRPNPAVGAVIVKKGTVIGEGWHRKAGCDHAEAAAIKDALRRMKRSGAARAPRPLAGSTIYVTLEPCSKPGRVGACTDAIAAAGISRVVYAVPDPNPKNRGKARRALAKAGVKCERFRGDAEVLASADDLVCDFRKHVTTGLPFVTVKIAMSLDGKICDDTGNAKWISSAGSRRMTGGKLREIYDAIMVGAETVRKDNPSLLSHGRRNDDLIRVIVSKSGNLPKDAQVFTDGAPNQTLVFDDAEKAVRELGRMGVVSVLCEGGLALARSLAEAGLVDDWVTVLAPVVIGSRPIGRALRGKFNDSECFFAHGDGFLTADFAMPRHA